MRRSENEITNINDLEAIISRAQVCRIAMCHENKPYIVPVNFGYKDMAFYIHGAKSGKKIELIKTNPNVVIEIDEIIELVTGELACDYTMKFKSIIAEGVAEILTDNQDKIDGLDIIMSGYTKENEFNYSQRAIDAVTIIKIIVTSITGKQSSEN